MRILFCTVPFRPAVGGIETVSELLAERFHRAGHEVVLMTRTPSIEDDRLPYRVVRQPSAWQLLRWTNWSDVVFHNNISLRFGWPLLVMRRPWVIAHHTWIPPHGLPAALKRRALHRASHIALSQAMARRLPVPSAVVPNPYADDVFRPVAGVRRVGDLVFVGRLVSEKGVQVLLEALAMLATQGRRPRLMVVGDGPDGTALRERAHALGLAEQVEFAGRRSGTALAAVLSAQQVLVAPSLGDETFGLVALEAMACGCVPLVSDSGGLPEAAGPAGVVVPKGDVAALATAIRDLLGDPERLMRHRLAAARHLERHRRDQVANAYLEVIAHASRSHTADSATRAA